MANENLPEKRDNGALAPKSIDEIFSSDYVVAALAQTAPKHLDPERFLRIANLSLKRAPKLKKCTLSSFWNCLLELSALGLEPDGRRAHIIPYGDKATLIVDYKGIVECVRRSGEVSDIYADVVCENDNFVFNMGRVTEHSIDFRKPRGAMYAAYSFVKFKDGTESYQVMSKDEIDAIRGRSKAGKSGPWDTDYNEMAKKSVFRRHSKWLPFSVEVKKAIEADDVHLFPDMDPTTVTESDIRDMHNGQRMKIRPKPVDPVRITEDESVRKLYAAMKASE